MGKTPSFAMPQPPREQTPANETVCADLKIVTSHLERWERQFELLRQFKLERGHVNVPNAYRSSDGTPLGAWVGAQKVAEGRGRLSHDRRERLLTLGLVLEPRSPTWDLKFALLVQFKRENGHVSVPQKYCSPDGTALGIWVKEQRRLAVAGRLQEDRRAKLAALGFVDVYLTEHWKQSVSKLEKCIRELHGRPIFPQSFRTRDGFCPSDFIQLQRRRFAAGLLSDDRQKILRDLGVKLERTYPPTPEKERWERNFLLLQSYAVERGHTKMPVGYVTADGIQLRSWLASQAMLLRKGKLNAERHARLVAIGWVAHPLEKAWGKSIAALAKCISENGGKTTFPRTFITPEGFRPFAFIARQLASFRAGELAAQRAEELRAVGVAIDRPSQPRKRPRRLAAPVSP